MGCYLITGMVLVNWGFLGRSERFFGARSPRNLMLPFQFARACAADTIAYSVSTSATSSTLLLVLLVTEPGGQGITRGQTVDLGITSPRGLLTQGGKPARKPLGALMT